MITHFARLGIDNNVLQVISINKKVLLNDFGVEHEELGIEYCVRMFGGRWKRTSLNGSFRKHFAGIGYIYREDLDAFIPPSPHQSWSLNQVTCEWEPPIPKPSDGLSYYWNEDIKEWVKSTQ